MVKVIQFSAVDRLTGCTSISNYMVLRLLLFSNSSLQSNQFKMLLMPLAEMQRRNHK